MFKSKYILVMILGIIVLRGAAQDITYNISFRDIVVARNTYTDNTINISIFNWASNSNGQKNLLDYSRNGYGVSDFYISYPNMYTLEVGVADLSPLYPLLGHGEIVQTNLETNEQNILFDTYNVTHMILSPTNEGAILQQYPRDVTVVERGMTLEWCLVMWSAPEKQCQLLNVYSSVPLWVSEYAVLVNSVDGMQLINTHTMEAENVADDELFFRAASLTQSERVLVVVQDKSNFRLCHMRLLEIKTRTWRDSQTFACSMGIHDLSVSPNERFVIIGGSENLNTFDIYDLSNGVLVGSHKAPLEMTWDNIFWINDDFVAAELAFKQTKMLCVVFVVTNIPDLLQIVSVNPLESGDMLFPIPDSQETRTPSAESNPESQRN